MKRKLKWGETPWDKLSREDLLREVQRMFSAVEAAHHVMGQHGQHGQHEPALLPYWSPVGVGGRALEMTRQIVDGVYAKFDRESVYRSFFRCAVDLLFKQDVETKTGFGWAVCPCGTMVGATLNRDGTQEPPPVGDPCPTCGDTLRRLCWKNLAPKVPKTKRRRCTCPTECDCESPDTNPALVSESCPVHNDKPSPSPTCPVHGRATTEKAP